MSRYRPQSGRILMELIYGEGPHMSHDSEGNITIDLTGMARAAHVRPARIIQNLEWLQSIGIITKLQHSYRSVTIALKGSDRINHMDRDN